MKAVIFDMDGVISDTQTLHAEAEEELFKRYGIEIIAQEITERYAGMSDKEFFETVFSEYGKLIHNVDMIIEEKWKKVLDLARGRISAIEGVVDLIEKLKRANFRLGLASAPKKEFIELVLSELKIKEYFYAVTSAYEVEFGKPNPAIFLLTAKKLSVLPEECTVIEDGKLGMVAAKKAGMKCIGLVNKDNVDKGEYKADKIVKRLTELQLSDFQ